ncbi:hypothetical protein ABW21_db0205000 [Orbilia brochopaga]|nr:hypothetical protein ABW21_db0205000 [Drechslerella brochopaga]
MPIPIASASPPSEAPSHASDGDGKHITLPYSLRDGIELLELVEGYRPWSKEGLDVPITWAMIIVEAKARACLVDTEMTGASLREHLKALTAKVYGNGLEYLDGEFTFSFVHEVGSWEEHRLVRQYRAVLSRVIQFWQLAAFEAETRRSHQPADEPSDERPPFDLHSLQSSGPCDITIAEMWEQALVRFARDRKPAWISELEERGIQRVGDLMSEEELSPYVNNFEDVFLDRVTFQLWDYLPPVNMNWQCRGIEYSDITAALAARKEKSKEKLAEMKREREKSRREAKESGSGGSGGVVAESRGSATDGSGEVCPSASVAAVTPSTEPTAVPAPEDREGGQLGHQEEVEEAEAKVVVRPASKRSASEAAGGVSQPVPKRARSEERASSPKVVAGGASQPEERVEPGPCGPSDTRKRKRGASDVDEEEQEMKRLRWGSASEGAPAQEATFAATIAGSAEMIWRIRELEGRVEELTRRVERSERTTKIIHIKTQ